MSKCCIIDENNKMIPLTHEETINKMTYILKNGEIGNGIIRFEDKSYEYIELNFDGEVIRILKDVTKLDYLIKQNLKLQGLINELRKENKGLIKDNLTKLYRADCAMGAVQQYIDYAYEKNVPFSLVMADIDKFKDVNDTYGHEIGNKVLEYVGKCLLNNLRTRTKSSQEEKRNKVDSELSSIDKNDIIIRYGGEEVLFLIKNITLNDTIERIEEIRKNIELLNPNGIHVTMSFGILNISDNSIFPEITKENIYKSVSELVQYADKAMYYSKQNGRNLTSVFDSQTRNCYIVNQKRNLK